MKKLIEQPGNLEFNIVNPNNGDGVSSQKATLNVAGPAVANVQFEPVADDARQMQVTINGANFRRGALVEFVKGDAGYEAKLNIVTASHVSIRLGSHAYGDYRFAIIPDKTPTIAFTETPAAQQNAGLKLAYKATDDYGVVKAAALIHPLDDKGQEIKSAETFIVCSVACEHQVRREDVLVARRPASPNQ